MKSNIVNAAEALEINLRNGVLDSARRAFIFRKSKAVPVLRSAAKRGMDVSVSLLMLLLLSPFFLVIVALIKLTDGGPVLFWQDRVGKFGKTFRFPKFRSMVVDAEALQRQLDARNQHGAGVTFKMKRDPRITWIGRIIRSIH